MRTAVATIVTAALWEQELVAAARRTGRVRIVVRCADPVAAGAAAGRVGAIVVGSATPWLSAGAVDGWRRAGALVVGVVESGDRAAHGRLQRLGCDIVAEDEPEMLLDSIALIGSSSTGRPDPWHVVTGPRGAPGRTEVALGLALALEPPVLLVEADRAAPSLGLRLGLPPERSRPQARRWGPIGVVTVSPGTTLAELDEIAAAWDGRVVVDAGPEPGQARRRSPARTVVVATATPVGMVRAAAFLAGVADLRPRLVLNRCRPGDAAVVAAVLGPPDAIIPELAAGWGAPPDTRLVDALRESPIVSGPPSGSYRGSADRRGWPEGARTRPPGRLSPGGG
jgi:hypothetical protein